MGSGLGRAEAAGRIPKTRDAGRSILVVFWGRVAVGAVLMVAWLAVACRWLWLRFLLGVVVAFVLCGSGRVLWSWSWLLLWSWVLFAFVVVAVVVVVVAAAVVAAAVVLSIICKASSADDIIYKKVHRNLRLESARGLRWAK